jgi:hypothetical protein
MRHSVPAASTVSCQDHSDSCYFVAALNKREEATERKLESQIFSRYVLAEADKFLERLLDRCSYSAI